MDRQITPFFSKFVIEPSAFIIGGALRFAVKFGGSLSALHVSDLHDVTRFLYAAIAARASCASEQNTSLSPPTWPVWAAAAGVPALIFLNAG
jgi:hypothetical protein